MNEKYPNSTMKNTNLNGKNKGQFHFGYAFVTLPLILPELKNKIMFNFVINQNRKYTLLGILP